MEERELIIYAADNLDEINQLISSSAERGLAWEFIPVRSLEDLWEQRNKVDCDLVITEEHVGGKSAFGLVEIFLSGPVIVVAEQPSLESTLGALRAGAKDIFFKRPGADHINDLLEAAERHIRDGQNDKRMRSYHKELERIISTQSNSLKESNQRLSSEIQQRTQAVNDLVDTREIYRKFFQTSQDAVFISYRDGRWIDLNNAALELFGYDDRQEIWDDSVLDFYLNPVDRQTFLDEIQEKGLVKDYLIKLRKKDGGCFDALISASSCLVAGEFVGYQGFIRDISEKVESEKEKLRLKAQQEVLDSLAKSIGSSLDLPEIGEGISEQLRKIISFDVFNLLRFDPQTEEFRSAFLESDLNAGLLKSIQPALAMDEPLLLGEWLYGSRSPQMISDLLEYLDLKDNLKGDDKKTVSAGAILVPLMAERKLIGLLQLVNLHPKHFHDQDLDLVSRVSSVVGIGIQKTFLFEESKAMVKKLTSLQRIEHTILESLSLPTTIDLTLDILVQELDVDAADVLYLHPQQGHLKQYSLTGFRQKIFNFSTMEIGAGLGGSVAQSRETLFIPDLADSEQEIIRELEFETEKFHSYIGVPLLNKGKLVGVMEIFHRKSLDPSPDWFNLLEIVAGMLAIAIDFQNLRQSLESSRTEISTSFDRLIRGWAVALELRGIESRGHSTRIEDLTLELADRLGLGDEEKQHLLWGALLHDIGKMGISDEILLKRSGLTSEERTKINKHPQDAYDLLKSIKILKPSLSVPLYHHERWDGAGYPSGIGGEEIPFLARIFAVIDVWDALLTNRPYRKAFSREEAIQHVREQSGKHFDPQVVSTFLEMIESWEVPGEEEQELEELAEPAPLGDQN